MWIYSIKTHDWQIKTVYYNFTDYIVACFSLCPASIKDITARSVRQVLSLQVNDDSMELLCA